MSIAARFRIDRGDFSLDVDLSLPGRGITALFGPSGCGKTTFLRAIAGLESAPGGFLRIGDAVWQDKNVLLPTHRRPIGYVFQEPSLFGHLSVRRNIEYGLRRLSRSAKAEACGPAVDLLGLEHLLDRMPHQLSGGEQQRVAIARALAVRPTVLLLDEPLAALDAPRKQEILPYLESLHHELEIPVLYVSHSRDEVARLADHLVLMDAGRVVAAGSLRDLFARLDLTLAQGPETETVIETVVGGHDEEFELTFLDFDGGRFCVAGNRRTPGSSARVRVRASDVSITLAHQDNTSISNIFPAVVDEMADAGSARVTVRMLIGTSPLLSRITRKSAVDLGLKPGKVVFAQVKSVALLS